MARTREVPEELQDVDDAPDDWVDAFQRMNDFSGDNYLLSLCASTQEEIREIIRSYKRASNITSHHIE